MSLQRPFLGVATIVAALMLNSGSLLAQGRFQAVSREAIPGVPSLEAVIIHDAVMDACYTVFVMAPAPTALPQSANLADAARARDQQLAALSDEFQRGLSGAVPATLGSNPLKYEWEAQKIQSEYERLVRQSEMVRLEAQLAQLAGAVRLSVAGPTACAKPAPTAAKPVR